MLLFLAPPLPPAKPPVAGKVQPPKSPRMAPLVPAGATPRWVARTRAIVVATQRRDWALAKRLYDRLPGKKVSVSLDLSGVPAASRATIRESVLKGLRQFGPVISYEIALVPKTANPHLAISFVPELAVDSELGAAPGLALLGGTQGMMEGVIGLRRGATKRAMTPDDARHAAARAVGATLGLADIPIYGAIMHEAPDSQAPPAPQPVEERTLRDMRSYELRLLKAITDRQPLIPVQASIQTDTDSLEAGDVYEGRTVEYVIQLSNPGSGPLAYYTLADCGCVIGQPSGVLPPGSVALIRPVVDTTNFDGAISKKLVIFHNDPTQPPQTFFMKANVRPELAWTGPNELALPKEGSKSVQMMVKPPRDLTITGVRLEGLDGVATLGAPVEGVYPIEATLTGKGLAQGRRQGAIVLVTGDESRPLRRRPFTIQRGIVASPDSVYFGLMDGKPKTISVQIVRPAQPFRVLSVVSSTPHVKVEGAWPTDAKDRHSMRVILTSGVRTEMAAKLTVTTDDPDQPTLEIPLTGTGL